jgi:hypothetical protein
MPDSTLGAGEPESERENPGGTAAPFGAGARGQKMLGSTGRKSHPWRPCLQTSLSSDMPPSIFWPHAPPTRPHPRLLRSAPSEPPTASRLGVIRGGTGGDVKMQGCIFPRPPWMAFTAGPLQCLLGSRQAAQPCEQTSSGHRTNSAQAHEQVCPGSAPSLRRRMSKFPGMPPRTVSARLRAL